MKIEEKIIDGMAEYRSYSYHPEFISINYCTPREEYWLYYNIEGSSYLINDGRFDLDISLDELRIRHLEDHFLDPLEPTAMENELFKLEFGLDFIDIMEKLKYGE